MNPRDRIVLLDNGSLRPEATRSLRRIASGLSARIGQPVAPVSLLHSSKIDPVELDGKPAQTWRRFLKAERATGVRRFFALPLFFGPSLAIVDYLPKATEQAVGGAGKVELAVARPLVDLDDPDDDGVARALARLAMRQLDIFPAKRCPTLVLVDHGSPAPAVTSCRDRVAQQMQALLQSRVRRVIPSSMERREGEAYTFSEPLLESVLDQLHREGESDVMLSLMFVSPGRHAGPEGDIARIAARSSWSQSGKPLPRAPLLGESPLLIDILERRYRQLVGP